MNLLKSKIFYIIVITISVLIIALVLFNTILFNYKSRLSNYLNDYYTTSSEESLTNINKLIDRYKNNKNRSNSISSLISSTIDKWINKYNDSYDSIDDLNTSYNYLVSKIDNLLPNLHNDLFVINKQADFIHEIDDLKESKIEFLNGLDYFNNTDYSSAYNEFLNVIENDSYYSETRDYIDECISSTLDKVTNEVNKLLTIDDSSTDSDKLTVYKEIYNYLIKVKKESKLALDKSKTFTDLLNEYETDLTNTYVSLAKSLATDNKYIEANTLLDEGIKLLTGGDVNVVALTDLKTAYALMEPVALTSINSNAKTGEWIKNDIAVIDNNNNTYPKALTFYKGPKKSYTKNSITYNINKEYKYLTFTLAMGKEITTKSKDTGTLKIIGDSKTLKNINLNGTISKEDMNIDLNNVNNLTFEYTIAYDGDSEFTIPTINVILGNPTLNKY
jgi:hypothetical protein